MAEKKIKNTIFVLMFLCSSVLLFGVGCVATTDVKKTVLTPASQTPVVEKIIPKVQMWPQTIEITAKVYDEKEKTYYNVKYEYLKDSGQSILSLDPVNSEEKMRSKIFLNKLNETRQVDKIEIWGVGNYECSYSYHEMSGSLCQVAENKYKYFCSPEKMNCEAIIEEILLKEPREWL